MKALAKKEKAAAAGANVKMLKRKQKKSKECAKEAQRATSVVTENVTDGWHRGRTELFTSSEDKDHIAFHNDHFHKKN